MRNIVFEPQAFQDFNNWAREDKKIYGKIVNLISDILRSPFDGIGKPEPLKYELKFNYGKEKTMIETTFVKVLEAADGLLLEEQENLVEILQNRLRDRRRAELIKDVKEAQQEFESGQCKPVSPEQLIIESAILELKPNEFRQVVEWLLDLDYQRWNEELEADVEDGKLELLAQEAIYDFENGFCKQL